VAAQARECHAENFKGPWATPPEFGRSGCGCENERQLRKGTKEKRKKIRSNVSVSEDSSKLSGRKKRHDSRSTAGRDFTTEPWLEWGQQRRKSLEKRRGTWLPLSNRSRGQENGAAGGIGYKTNMPQRLCKCGYAARSRAGGAGRESFADKRTYLKDCK